MENWIENDDYKSIVLNSRVSLSRNLRGMNFPSKLSDEKARDVVKIVEDGFFEGLESKEDYKTICLWQKNKNENMSAFERHLISINLLNTAQRAAFITSSDETMSVMINEEDHIRLQGISAGMSLKKVYDSVNELDDRLENNLDFAFDEKLGYITSCPANLGTGMRASIMLHLPALSNNDEMNGIFKTLTQVGMTIRGIYGEGSKGYGNIYQVSNQTTLGVTEDDILSSITSAVSQLVNQERSLRNKVMQQYGTELEDKIFRSFGILKNARILQTREALDLLSNVRMGIEMGMIPGDNIKWNRLLVDIQPSSLQLRCGKELSSKECDMERAKLVREHLLLD